MSVRRLAITSLLVLCTVSSGRLWGGSPSDESRHLDEVPVSELDFPIVTHWTLKDTRFDYRFTGESQRKFLFMRIYDVAHYVGLNDGAVSLENVFDRGINRQLLIRYHHDIAAQRLRSALWDGFERNSSDTEWKELEPVLHNILAGIKHDVRSGDELIIRWMSDDRVLFHYNNKLIAGYRGHLFARVLWAIWLSAKSVVDEKELTRFLGAAPSMLMEMSKPER